MVKATNACGVESPPLPWVSKVTVAIVGEENLIVHIACFKRKGTSASASKIWVDISHGVDTARCALDVKGIFYGNIINSTVIVS